MKSTPSNLLKNYSQLVLTILAVASLFPPEAICQRTPAPNGVKMTDSLMFVAISASAQTSVVYHPVYQKYYSVRAGLTTYPLETWNQTGGLSVVQTTAGLDTRGMWWNPNTNQVERNCFGSIGWGTVNLDAGGNALNTFSMLFTGQKQPNVQSVGAYDYKTNTVIFNNSGIISIYDRNSGILTGTLPLTGTSLAGINIYTVIYTGETGYEIGILDYIAKKILLFDRATGIFSGSSQLPATAITHNQFRFSYSNFRVWLFNVTARSWNSYNIWNSLLPIKLLSFTAMPNDNSEIACSWTTVTEVNNDYFTLERSADGNSFETIGEVDGAGNSTTSLTYSFPDEDPFQGISYYRLKQTDFDGRFSYSHTLAVRIGQSKVNVVVYPNPASNHLFVSFSGEDKEDYSVKLFDGAGRVVFSRTGVTAGDGTFLEVNTTEIPKGFYNLQFITKEVTEQKRIVIQ